MEENKNTNEKEMEKSKECPHNNVTFWNHGYHSLCIDCGERDIY